MNIYDRVSPIQEGAGGNLLSRIDRQYFIAQIDAGVDFDLFLIDLQQFGFKDFGVGGQDDPVPDARFHIFQPGLQVFPVDGQDLQVFLQRNDAEIRSDDPFFELVDCDPDICPVDLVLDVFDILVLSGHTAIIDHLADIERDFVLVFVEGFDRKCRRREGNFGHIRLVMGISIDIDFRKEVLTKVFHFQVAGGCQQIILLEQRMAGFGFRQAIGERQGVGLCRCRSQHECSDKEEKSCFHGLMALMIKSAASVFLFSRN